MKVKAVKVNRAHYFLTDPRIIKTFEQYQFMVINYVYLVYT